MKEKKIRDLVKPQNEVENLKDNLVIPYCSSGYSNQNGQTRCGSGYSDNLWCTSDPSPGSDDVLF